MLKQECRYYKIMQDLQILEKLGRGSTCFVLKVRYIKNKQTQKYYVKQSYQGMKVFDKISQKYRKLKKRLLNQIQIQSQLDHPNILKLYDHFQDQDNYYLLIQYCEFGQLTKKIKEKKTFSQEETRKLAIQISNALYYLHQKKIIHRDIKPGNILINYSNNYKLSDFGWSTKSNGSPLKQICGTPSFMAPEILEKPFYDSKIDIWSYGVLLYTVLYGCPPFTGDSPEAVINNIKKMQLNYDNLSPQLQILLRKTISFNPKHRLTFDQIKKQKFITGQSMLFKTPEKLRYQSPIQKRIAALTSDQKKILFQKIRSKQGHQISRKDYSFKKCLSNGHLSRPMQHDRFSKTFQFLQKLRTKQQPRELIQLDRLPLLNYDTPRGKVQILPNGINVQVDNRQMKVYKNDIYIYQGKKLLNFQIQNLPLQYHKLYFYCQKIVKILKSKIPYIQHKTINASYSLMCSLKHFAAFYRHRIIRHQITESDVIVQDLLNENKRKKRKLNPMQYLQEGSISQQLWNQFISIQCLLLSKVRK